MRERLRRAPRLKLRGRFARHTHPLAALEVPPPLVLLDDRWQRAGDESVLYACDGEDTVWAEWRRKLPEGVDMTETVRKFGWLAVSLDDVVDLRDPAVRDLLGLDEDDLTGDDRTTCHALLAAARTVGLDALVAPSAARHGGTTVIILPHAIKQVDVVSEERRIPPP